MDTDLNTPTTSKPATPFPSTNQGAAPAPASATVESAADAARNASDTLLRRATQGAHDVIDGISAKVSGVATGAQGKVDQVLQTRDEWTGAARDVVREHPLLAIGGALLFGAALNALLSSRRDR